MIFLDPRLLIPPAQLMNGSQVDRCKSASGIPREQRSANHSYGLRITLCFAREN
jgi:hypothetical protein